MKKLTVVLLILTLVFSMVFAAGATEKKAEGTKVGVSIMELAAYTLFLPVVPKPLSCSPLMHHQPSPL